MAFPFDAPMPAIMPQFGGWRIADYFPHKRPADLSQNVAQALAQSRNFASGRISDFR
jgi:hypothetical protein